MAGLPSIGHFAQWGPIEWSQETEACSEAWQGAQPDSAEWYSEHAAGAGGSGGWGVQQVPGAVDRYSISTPRLNIFNMATPRKPATPSLGQRSRAPFVPHWPYSSHWPFCRAPTTLELRNVPASRTAEALIAQLHAWGFAGRFDFVFVQAGGSRSQKESRHALVNTVRHADGRELADRLHGFCDWGEGEERPCKVSWSFSLQGLEELVLNHQNQLGAWREDGSYTGAWASYNGAWMPVVAPPSDEAISWVPVCVPVECMQGESPSMQETTEGSSHGSSDYQQLEEFCLPPGAGDEVGDAQR